MSIEDELRKKHQLKLADERMAAGRARAADAARIAHIARNNRVYNSETMEPAPLLAQLRARVEAAKPPEETLEQRVANFNVSNAIAKLRADKGIESPHAAETEYVPTIEEVLGAVDVAAEVEEIEPQKQPGDVSYTALDLVKTSIAQVVQNRKRKGS